ncbi:MAG: hypothetical protein AB8B60_15105 [Sulfitobacter sp.]
MLIYLHFLCIFKLLAAVAATLHYAPISPNLPLDTRYLPVLHHMRAVDPDIAHIASAARRHQRLNWVGRLRVKFDSRLKRTTFLRWSHRSFRPRKTALIDANDLQNRVDDLRLQRRLTSQWNSVQINNCKAPNARRSASAANLMSYNAHKSALNQMKPLHKNFSQLSAQQIVWRGVTYSALASVDCFGRVLALNQRMDPQSKGLGS